MVRSDSDLFWTWVLAEVSTCLACVVQTSLARKQRLSLCVFSGLFTNHEESQRSLMSDLFLNLHKITDQSCLFVKSSSKCQPRHFGASLSDLGGACYFAPQVCCVNALFPYRPKRFPLLSRKSDWFTTSTCVIGSLTPF